MSVQKFSVKCKGKFMRVMPVSSYGVMPKAKNAPIKKDTSYGANIVEMHDAINDIGTKVILVALGAKVTYSIIKAAVAKFKQHQENKKNIEQEQDDFDRDFLDYRKRR